jgi:hypothetical protein
VIEVAEVYDSIVEQEWESEANAVTTELRKLAALAERIIPPDYSIGDPQKTLDATRKLADLSERYGDPIAASVRRRVIVPPVRPRCLNSGRHAVTSGTCIDDSSLIWCFRSRDKGCFRESPFSKCGRRNDSMD